MTKRLDPSELSSLFLKQGGRCFYCDRHMDPIKFDSARVRQTRNGYTKDHFFPRAVGMPLRKNCVLAHRKCNGHKGDRIPTAEEITKFVAYFGQIAPAIIAKACPPRPTHATPKRPVANGLLVSRSA